jgi:hypothetical protein
VPCERPGLFDRFFACFSLLVYESFKIGIRGCIVVRVRRREPYLGDRDDGTLGVGREPSPNKIVDRRLGAL